MHSGVQAEAVAFGTQRLVEVHLRADEARQALQA
jgi:hypothetical protein